MGFFFQRGGRTKSKASRWDPVPDDALVAAIPETQMDIGEIGIRWDWVLSLRVITTIITGRCLRLVLSFPFPFGRAVVVSPIRPWAYWRLLDSSPGGPMPNPTPERKRSRCQRLPLPIPLFVRGLDKNGRSFLEFTSALNFSASGALVAMRRGLPVSSQLSIEIPCAPLHLREYPTGLIKILEAKLVRVVHLEECDLWGLRFTHPMRSNSGIRAEGHAIHTGNTRVDLGAGIRDLQPPSGMAEGAKMLARGNRSLQR